MHALPKQEATPLSQQEQVRAPASCWHHALRPGCVDPNHVACVRLPLIARAAESGTVSVTGTATGGTGSGTSTTGEGRRSLVSVSCCGVSGASRLISPLSDA